MEVTTAGWVDLQNNIGFLEEHKDPYNRENNSSKIFQEYECIFRNNNVQCRIIFFTQGIKQPLIRI
jgi:hypothetical protein